MKATRRAIYVSSLAVGMAAPAIQADELHHFNIDGANATTALQTFAAQSGMQILASATGLTGRQLNPVAGELSAESALRQMLAGTGLNYRYVSTQAVAVVAAPIVLQAAITQPVPAAKNAEAGFELEEILVTARRREENLQDTPISVAAFSGAGLEERQVFNTEDLDQITPNLQFATIAPLSGNNSAAQVFIRGIGQTDATAGVDPGVGLYIDDVYMGSAVGGAMDFRDIAGVQVLRGPQGTLFGRNTIGGALLITTTEPGAEFGGSAKIGTGSDNLREAFVAVDAPVADTLRSRWTFGMRARDGYVHRPYDGVDLGDVNNFSVTGKVTWSPSESFKLALKGDYTAAREHGTPLVFAAINETAAFPRSVSFNAGCPGMASVGSTVPQVDDPRCANDYWNDGPYTANGTFPLKSELENSGVAAIATWDMTSALSFKSITSYRQLEWAGKRDADNTPFPILHTDYDSDGHQFSQELQSLFKSNSLNGVVGLFYFKQRTEDNLTVTLSPPPSPTGTQDSNDNDWDNSNWAAFTQWSWQIVDQLSFTGGLRYTSETKRSRPDQYNYSNPSVLYLPYKWYEKKFNATTGSAALQYRWNPAVMTYASWSEGFKSGGFNSRFNGVVAAGEPPSFDAETADSKEVGIKLDLFSSLRLNLAIFSTKYDDLQFTYRVGTAPFLFNAGKASIEGAELEFQYVPISQWRIEGGAGYLDASIDEVAAIVGATTSVTTDSRLPYTPKLTGNLAVSYKGTWGKATFTPRVEASYTGKQFFDAGNTVEIAQNDNITVYNASATVAELNERWSLTLGVSNIGDEIYPIAGNSSLTTGSGYAEIAYNRGREWFANFGVNF